MDPRCIVFTQKADIPPCLGKIFKLKTYRLLQDALVSQKKLKEDIFNHAPPPHAKLSQVFIITLQEV